MYMRVAPVDRPLRTSENPVIRPSAAASRLRLAWLLTLSKMSVDVSPVKVNRSIAA
jgi:hypothetical protein